jgi:hypothetical protein
MPSGVAFGKAARSAGVAAENMFWAIETHALYLVHEERT